jgi:hypothetical protein
LQLATEDDVDGAPLPPATKQQLQPATEDDVDAAPLPPATKQQLLPATEDDVVGAPLPPATKQQFRRPLPTTGNELLIVEKASLFLFFSVT